MALIPKVFLYIGIFLINIVIYRQVAGNVISWGTFSPYVSAYFHLISPETTPSDLLLVPIFMLASGAISFVFISNLSIHISPIYFIIFGILFCCPSLFLASYLTDPILFSFIFGISIGILGNCCFMPSVWIAWSVVPENKATSAGIALAAHSISPVIFGTFFTLFTNPNEIQAVLDSTTSINYFPVAVATRVPTTIQYFSVTLFFCGAIGSFFLRSNYLKINSSTNTNTITTAEMVKNWKVWYLFFMNFVFCLYNFYLINTYKDIAMKHINDDFFLAYVGAISFIVGSFGRVYYGRALDLYSWKWVMGFAIGFQIVCAALMEFSFMSKYFFAVVFFVGSFTGNAMYLGVMIITDKAFPQDRWIFSYVNLALIFDMIAIYLIRNYFAPVVGEAGTNYFMALILTIGLIQVFCQIRTGEYEKLS